VGSPDFIYNRTTDFYFQDDSYKNLKDLFLNKKSCFSPNPFEYFLLADKQRMIDWYQSTSVDTIIREHLPICMDLKPENADEIWANRKRFFFKPKTAYGSKQTYGALDRSRAQRSQRGKRTEPDRPQDRTRSQVCVRGGVGICVSRVSSSPRG
jgi:hypothetical protein